MSYTLGIDIGGTKIASVIIDRSYNIISRAEVESVNKNQETLFAQVIKAIDLTIEKSNLTITDLVGVGVGVPGKIDKKKGIAIYQNNIPWENFPIVSRLQKEYSIKNVWLDNDVYLATLAEWKVSNIHKNATFVYLTVSTGISCSIIHQGNFVRGDGFAGEIGLLPVETEAFEPKIDRLEQVASGPAIEKAARKLLFNKNINAKEVFEEYYEGHKKADQIISSVTKSIAHGVYSIICLLDPQQIVFGGGVINNNPLMIELIKEHLTNFVVKEQKNSLANIKLSHFTQNAGVIGAGIYAFKEGDVR